jgi:hypothetical protein
VARVNRVRLFLRKRLGEWMMARGAATSQVIDASVVTAER